MATTQLRRIGRPLLPVLAALMLVVGLLGLGVSPTAGTRARPAGATVTLSVMTQNIFYGGDDYDLRTGRFCRVSDGCPQALRRLARVIARAGADVVGVQEPERNIDRLARLLGWYGSARAHVVSRYPLVDPPGSRGRYVFVEPTPGRVLAVANVHLPSTPYGPYEVRDGATRRDLRRVELTTRMPAVTGTLRALRRLGRHGIPVVLTGDFNSPSHLDWTSAVSAVRSDVPYPFQWPVSRAIAEAGFTDSYREVHPDPVARPGFTWTPGGPETAAHEVFDRIDWVLHAGRVETLDSRLVGESGGPDVDLGVKAPYPSDHRGVVSTMAVTLARSPVLVSPAVRRLTTGDPLTVTYHTPRRGAERVALVRRHASGRTELVRSKPVHPSRRRDGTVRFPTTRLHPGRYDVVLIARHGRRLSSSPVWAYRPGTSATVETTRRHYAVGDPIRVRWTHAPGMGLDWVGVFRCRQGRCASNDGYLLYAYTRTAIEGHRTIGPTAATLEGAVSWPLPSGTYVTRLLVDDSYVDLAQSPRFSIE